MSSWISLVAKSPPPPHPVYEIEALIKLFLQNVLNFGCRLSLSGEVLKLARDCRLGVRVRYSPRCIR